MNKNTIIKIINSNIRELEMLINAIKEDNDIPEMELVLSKIDILSKEIKLLSESKSNTKEVVEKVEKQALHTDEEKPELGKVEESVEEIVKIKDEIKEEHQKEIIQPKIKEINNKSKSKHKTIVIPAKKKKKEDIIPEIIEEPVETKNVVEEPKKLVKDKNETIVVKEETVVKKATNKKSNQIVADKFMVTKQSINDIIAGEHKSKNLASKFTDKPIKDIKQAIRVNDKIMFIKELFGGDSVKYNESIDIINNKQNLNEALEYLNSNFKWNQESESFVQFIELIYRRFM